MSSQAAPVEGGTRQMSRRMGSVAICQERGWGVGTRLVGDEGYGPSVIEITAIGESHVLAKKIAPELWGENLWTLSCRDWTEVGA